MRLTKTIFKISAVIVAGLLFWEGRPVEKLFFVLIAAPAYGFGYFIFRDPMRMFAIQKRFYARINWRIEPISVEQEIRNTRGMGVMLMILVIISGLFLVITGSG